MQGAPAYGCGAVGSAAGAAATDAPGMYSALLVEAADATPVVEVAASGPS
jgi:hypothetical protein